MSSLFVQDQDIHVTKSPFSAYENEQKIYDGRLTPISMEHQMFKVNRGHIIEIDYIILEALSTLGFATSRMVTQYLEYIGITEFPQLKVSNRLKFMSNINLITRFKFCSEKGDISSRFYCLEKTGKYLLLAREKSCDWKPSFNTKPLPLVKEILSRNQLLLSYMSKVKGFSNYNINPTVKLLKSGRLFNPHLIIDITSDDNQNHKFFFEFVRSYSDSKERLIERLLCYQEYYEYFTPSQDQFTAPKLIIVGEDDVHVGDIYRTIVQGKIKFKGTDLLFTTDLRILDSELNKSNYEFELFNEEGKVRAKIKIKNFEMLKRG